MNSVFIDWYRTRCLGTNLPMYEGQSNDISKVLLSELDLLLYLLTCYFTCFSLFYARNTYIAQNLDG